jgi:adenine deaminase
VEPLDPTLDELAAAVAVAAGRRPASLLLANARLLNVFTGAIEEASVAISGRLIAAVLPLDAVVDADVRVDLGGAALTPALIDAHVHVESSLLTPIEYARAVLPRGVTGIVTDPHEIANVAGEAGVRWWLAAAEGVPFDLWATVPSCVPATPLERSGAEFGVGEIDDLLAHPRVLGLAELMDFPAVIAGEMSALAKVAVTDHAHKVSEGHAPGLSGRALQAYVAAGVASDHESTTLAEAREKLAAGLFVMIREGSVTRDFDALRDLIDPKYADRVGFATDDRLPRDLRDEGGVDLLVRRAIAAGVDPVYAVRCASWNTARHYRLPRRGAIAPGYFADLVVVDDLAHFTAARVYRHGRQVAARDGSGGVRVDPWVDAAATAAAERARARPGAASVRASVQLPEPLAAEDLLPLAPAGGASVRVIRTRPRSVVTEEIWLTPRVEGGRIVAMPDVDVALLACLHRHGRPRGRGIGVGLVQGLALARGALAVSVGHDHHNLMVAGVDPQAMLRAARRLRDVGGGFVVDDGERVIAELALPIAGLVSDAPLLQVIDDLDVVAAAVRSLGAAGAETLMTLSFLGLAVIPALRVTDQGLVDVNAAKIVPLA